MAKTPGIPESNAPLLRPPAENEPRLELTTHYPGVKVSVFVQTPVPDLLKISAYLQARIRSERVCYLCETKHDSPQLCFKSDDFDVPDLELLRDILDDCLWFSLEDGIHERIFLLCNYFLIDQDFCFPLFYR